MATAERPALVIYRTADRLPVRPSDHGRDEWEQFAAAYLASKAHRVIDLFLAAIWGRRT